MLINLIWNDLWENISLYFSLIKCVGSFDFFYKNPKPYQVSGWKWKSYEIQRNSTTNSSILSTLLMKILFVYIHIYLI